MSDYLIWWTSQDECEQIEEIEPLLPDYIQDEFESRLGRSGRGRLWIHQSIPIKGIDWNEARPAARLCSERGGIVIKAIDKSAVFDLPGFLTDLGLNFLNE